MCKGMKNHKAAEIVKGKKALQFTEPVLIKKRKRK